MKFILNIDKNAEETVVATVHSPSALTRQIEDLVFRFCGEDSIAGYRDDEICRLSFDEIECITVSDRKVIAIDLQGNRYRLQKRLRELEDMLPSYFIRINKSSLANEHRIAKFEAVFSGGVNALFYCGYREYVSRRCFAEIKRRYEKL